MSADDIRKDAGWVFAFAFAVGLCGVAALTLIWRGQWLAATWWLGLTTVCVVGWRHALTRVTKDRP